MTTADAIVLARTIHTLDPHKPHATALAIAAGRIAAVGSYSDVEPYRSAATVVHDYGDATIVPGLNDSHTHVVFGLDLVRGIRLTDVGPLAEVKHLVSGAVQAAGGGTWITGWGLDPTTSPKRGSTAGSSMNSPATGQCSCGCVTATRP